MSHHLRALLNGIIAELDTLGHLRRTPRPPARLIQATRVMKNDLALYVLTSNSIPHMHTLCIWTVMPPCPFNKIDQTQEWGAQGMHKNIQEIARRQLKNMMYFSAIINATRFHIHLLIASSNTQGTHDATPLVTSRTTH